MEQTVDVERLKRHLSEVAWAPTVEISRAELVAVLSRLEQSEQAVQRVREVADLAKQQEIHMQWISPEEVFEALEGDGRG